MGSEARRLFGALHPDVEVVSGPEGTWRADGRFHPLPEHRGKRGWLHGGLAATVLDHVCARAASAALGQPVVTGRLDIRYHEPVLLAAGPYRVVATTESPRSRTVRVNGELRRGRDVRLVSAVSLFVAVDDDDCDGVGEPRD